jgi:hypothetical protein
MPIWPIFRDIPLFIAWNCITRLTGLLARCNYTRHLDVEPQDPNLFITARHEYQSYFRTVCVKYQRSLIPRLP